MPGRSLSAGCRLALWRMWAAMSVLVGTALVFAQVPTGDITGVVRDSSAAAIPGATVTATSRETGIARTTQTGADGRYRLAALQAGMYDVRAEAPSFTAEVRQGVELSVARSVVSNFSLSVGAVQESVTVQAEAAMVETTSGSLSGLVNEQRIAELPLNGRNYTDLVLLQPGINIHVPRTATSVMGLAFSSNGAPIRSNYMMLDGANLLSKGGTSGVSISGSMLGVEGVREFRVITNSFPAEYGMTMGSQITVVSKGGTNEFHGSAFEFLRNSALDARNFFDRKLHDDEPRTPPFRRNQFGASFGGPMRRNKAFFFVTYEGIRESLGLTQVLGTITAEARRDGFLAPRVADAIKPYLALYPLPTEPLPTDPTGRSGVGRFTYVYQQPTSENFGQSRVDYNFSENDSIFVRYTIDDTRLDAPVQFPQFIEPRKSRGQFITLAGNHIFSPRVLNVFRLSYSRPYQEFGAPSIAELEFLPGALMGRIDAFGGVSRMGPAEGKPTINHESIGTLSDDLAFSLGSHMMKLGVLINRFRTSGGNSSLVRGAYSFSTVGDFLQAIPLQFSSVTLGSTAYKNYGWTTFGFYLQDDWNIGSRFTLNPGLRYEMNTTQSERSGHGSSVRDLLHDSAPVLAPELYENPSLRNFGPRLGFAWDIGGNAKTVLRGGYGLLYDMNTIWTASQDATPPPPFGSTVILRGNVPFPHPVVPTAVSQGRSFNLLDFHIQQSHMEQYNLTLERSLPAAMMLSLTYAGSRGFNLMQHREGNPRVPSAQIDGRDFYTGLEPRLNSSWDNIGLKTAGGDSWYNSLQFGLQKRLSRGLQFQSSYTWSKTLDTGQGQVPSEGAGNAIIYSDPNHPGNARGRADFDTPHFWTLNVIYDLPLHGTGIGHLLNGWRVGTIFTAGAGHPFSPTLSGNRSRSGVGSNNPDPPDMVAGRHPADIQNNSPEQWFDPSAFSIPPVGFLGTVGRSFLQGAGLANLNFSLAKDTPLPMFREGAHLEFRTEFFNLLNRANFRIPDAANLVAYTADATRAIPTPLASAGQITGTTTSSRQIQFAMKLIF